MVYGPQGRAHHPIIDTLMKRALDNLPEMMKNPAFKQAWEDLEDKYQIAAILIEARKKAGMTQAEVAEKMGVEQPVIARMESGRNISIKSIKKYANATRQPILLAIDPA